MKIRDVTPFPVATMAALLCMPAFALGQSILGTADNFTILGGTAVTSTGTVGTIISGGDVGSAAAVTGFPPATDTGTIHNGADTAVSQALLDLEKAQVGLAAMTPTTIEASTELAGLTLLPGVYNFSGTAVLDGALTLDANGQNNAVWVFQINSTLTTDTGASVSIINLGSDAGIDDGIFWDTGTAINFGANNIILGNYLAGTAITFLDGTSGSGRALSQTGVTLATTTLDAVGPDGGWTSGLMYNAMGNVVPVPEPAAFLWLAPLGAMGLALWRRSRVNKAA